MLVEIFKNWISAMLCIGIFITFIQLIMPKSNLKKYIYSLVGVLTVITVLSPVVNLLKNQSIETSINQVLENISQNENTTTVSSNMDNTTNQENVKKAFIESVKKDVNNKLTSQKIVVNNVQIIISDEYDIEKIDIKIGKLDGKVAKLSSVNDVVKYINEQYDIDFSKITVVEEDL